MNMDNIKYCIGLMQKAKRLYMPSWQINPSYDEHIANKVQFASTIAELHSWGNTACFAGYVCLSERFKADGGTSDPFCECQPVLNNRSGHEAIAEWLDISNELAHLLVMGKPKTARKGEPDFYDVPFKEVKPKHVIEKLRLILAGKLT